MTHIFKDHDADESHVDWPRLIKKLDEATYDDATGTICIDATPAEMAVLAKITDLAAACVDKTLALPEKDEQDARRPDRWDRMSVQDKRRHDFDFVQWNQKQFAYREPKP